MKSNKKRIIWLIPSVHTTFDQYSKKFERMGFELEVIHCRTILEARGLKFLHSTIRAKVEGLTGADDFLLITFFDGSIELSPEYLRTLPDNLPKIIWNFDDEIYGTHSTIYRVQSVDGIITTDYYGGHIFKQIGIPVEVHLCGAYDFSESALDSNEPMKRAKSIDICFIGDIKKHNRSEYISFLIDNKINVEVFGSGSKNGRVSNGEMKDIYSKSKICLNFSESDVSFAVYKEEPWRSSIKQIKGRPFEICSSGSFCLTESAPGLDKYFRPGVELVIFDSRESLLKNVKKYLLDEKLREEIALCGMEKSRHWNSDQFMLDTVKSILKLIRLNKNPLLKCEIIKSQQYVVKEIYYSILFAIRHIKLLQINYALDVLIYFKSYKVLNPIILFGVLELILSRYAYFKKN